MTNTNKELLDKLERIITLLEEIKENNIRDRYMK